MTPLRFTGAWPRLGQSLETVALSGAELEVRIHSAPADSPSLSGFRLRPRKDAGFPPFWRPCGAAVSAERAKSSNIAPRAGSVSAGRYSSTAVLPEAVGEIGEIGLAISVGGLEFGSAQAKPSRVR